MDSEVPQPISAEILEREIQNWIREIGYPHACVKAIRISRDIALLPEEIVHIENSVEKRKAEFASGRYCARKALAQLGLGEVSIPRGSRGEPIWPDSVVGSITHDQGLAVAVVSPAELTTALGIDMLSLNHRIDRATASMIAGEAELLVLGRMLAGIAKNPPGSPDVDPLLLAFSAKEAVIKSVSPSIDYYLDFLDIGLEDRGDTLFAVIGSLQTGLRVDWRIIGNFMITVSCTPPAA
ncbi:MAG TPA: hypothetical protein VKB27_04510 [Gammaproteobacteria bacterium]|nr:hypothetical protein [Gammaproteobacteria bacterium]